jgi:hypothetical protein
MSIIKKHVGGAEGILNQTFKDERLIGRDDNERFQDTKD